MFRSYAKNARKKDLSWDLTGEDFDRLTSLECFYCGCPPSTVNRRDPGYAEFVYNGLDRVDNAQGYTLDKANSMLKLSVRLTSAAGASWTLYLPIPTVIR